MKTKSIKIENLFLDPNNPRFINDFDRDMEPDSAVKGLQTEILDKFKIDVGSQKEEDEKFTEIGVLYDSIKKSGFIPIDKPIVRLLKGSKDKYLVVEGNRRIASAKKILKDKKTRVEMEEMELLPSLQTIRVKIVETEGRPEEEVQAEVDQLLTQRHGDGLLGWGPVPLAHNMFTEYLALDPPKQPEDFAYNERRAKEMASVYGYKMADVKKSLYTYVAMKLLDDEKEYPVKPNHWSILQNMVCNEQLKVHLLDINKSTLRPNDESCVWINDYLQFDMRERNDQKKAVLLRNPAAVSKLARIYEATGHDSERVRNKAKKLLGTIHEGKLNENGHLLMPIDNAESIIKITQLSLVWLETLTGHLDLLDKKEALKVENYTGEGNAKAVKDEVKETNSFRTFKHIFRN